MVRRKPGSPRRKTGKTRLRRGPNSTPDPFGPVNSTAPQALAHLMLFLPAAAPSPLPSRTRHHQPISSSPTRPHSPHPTEIWKNLHAPNPASPSPRWPQPRGATAPQPAKLPHLTALHPQKSQLPPAAPRRAALLPQPNPFSMASAVSLLLLSSPRPLRRAAPVPALRSQARHPLLLGHAGETALGVWATRARLPAPPPRASNPNNDNDNSGAVEAPDRLVAAVAYLYPFLDGVHHGRFLLAQFPLFSTLLSPLAPAARLFRSSPLTPFLLFLTLYFAVVRNQQAFSRFVRFNAMQAVALDVLLIFPDLLVQSFAPSTGGGIGFELFQSMESTVFLFLLVCLVYGGGACLLGKTPRLPIVADAAERQVM